MPENIYLTQLRTKYTGLQQSIAGIQARANEAKRDLTGDELRSIAEMGEQGQALYTQIEDLTAIELRNAKVAQLTAAVASAVNAEPDASNGNGSAHTRSTSDTPPPGTTVRVGGATTSDRDPGIYTRASQHSFLGDQFRAARHGDEAARDRLIQHSNAMRDNTHLRDVLGGGATTFGAGLVPPVWLAEQFAPILHRRLRVAAALRQVPWPGTPFPWSIPISATAAATATVAEGVNPSESDPSYTVLTVTPSTIAGYSEVSRQMLEGSNPAVDAVIWGDLLGAFYDDAEEQTVAAIEAQANITLATVADGAVATTARNGILDAIAAVSDNSAGDADVFFSRTARWTAYLKLTDSTNRPLILSQRYSPQNAIGEGDLMNAFRQPVQGSLENLAVITTPTVNASRGYVINSQELLFSASPPMQFKFEEPAGPALIRIGVWGYMAVVTGRRPKAITRIHYSTG